LDEQLTNVTRRRDDPIWLDGIKYLFVTAIEACVDVAHHLAASERWGAPDTNAAAFDLLARHGLVDGDPARRLAKAVGFRNVLVHRYAIVDDDRGVAALDELNDLARFVRQVSAWLIR
jgi:uncharacterized protein YutE (UPF0331/DUF86 family)